MAQQFNYPNSETELRAIQDVLYRTAKAAHDEGKRPSFGGLIEIMSAKATIITAIHNIKANKGANTPGVDGVRIRNYLQSREDWVINDIQSAFLFDIDHHAGTSLGAHDPSFKNTIRGQKEDHDRPPCPLHVPYPRNQTKLNGPQHQCKCINVMDHRDRFKVHHATQNATQDEKGLQSIKIIPSIRYPIQKTNNTL